MKILNKKKLMKKTLNKNKPAYNPVDTEIAILKMLVITHCKRY